MTREKRAVVENEEMPGVAGVTLAGESQNPNLVIIGIGAAAGGIEALEAFLRQVSPGCGAAFIVVPHLDSKQASPIFEILQRVTKITVVEAQDQMIDLELMKKETCAGTGVQKSGPANNDQ